MAVVLLQPIGSIFTHHTLKHTVLHVCPSFIIQTISLYLFGTPSNFRPSPDLRPETNRTLETGIKISFDGVFIDNSDLQFGSTLTPKLKTILPLKVFIRQKYMPMVPR